MNFEIPTPIEFAIIAIVIFVVWQIYKRKIQRINQMPDIPPTMPAKGFEVPILAIFSGSKTLPRQISFSHNNLNPFLTLFEDRLDCKVILKKSIPFTEIENIDIGDTFATRNLQVYVKDQEDLFSANLLNRRNLAQVLRFLENRGVPLSNRSKAFLSANSA
jgi:hypothetical protein